MNKKLLLGLSAIMLATTLTGCSQVHFGRDAVTIGTEKKAKPKVEHKKDQVAKKQKAASSSSKKSVKKTTKKVEKTKTKDKNKKKPIKIGWSPLGKNKYQYNVVAIANDDFKSWHNTYLFCLKKNKPVILLDQSKKSGVVVVKNVKDATLLQGFEKAYKK